MDMEARGVHLVGSVPLENSRAVFRAASDILGEYVLRVPDGETGDRSNWVLWQLAFLAESPQLEFAETGLPDYGAQVSQVKIVDGASAADVELPELGYSTAAIASYGEFAHLKHAGEVAADCRFQVSLPTPLAPINFFVVPEHQASLEPVYEQALISELEKILAEIPPEELAIQWDTAVEFGILEGVFPTYLADPEPDIIERLVRLGKAVPDAVELGYHLCYGDSGHKHFVEPADTKKLVTVANKLVDSLGRSLDWLHLPVPRNRCDEGYFKPLKDLALAEDTELYLGLLHMTDQDEGAHKRIETARKYVANFGVATECGFGRRPAESVPRLMELHARVAKTL